MDIRRSGSQPSSQGPAEYFTGRVRIDANQRCTFGKSIKFCDCIWYGTIHGQIAMSAIE